MLIVTVPDERIVRAPSEIAHALGLLYAAAAVERRLRQRMGPEPAAVLAGHAGQWFAPQVTGALRWTEPARA